MRRILALLLICAVLSGRGATDSLTFNDGITFTDSIKVSLKRCFMWIFNTATIALN